LLIDQITVPQYLSSCKSIILLRNIAEEL